MGYQTGDTMLGVGLLTVTRLWTAGLLAGTFAGCGAPPPAARPEPAAEVPEGSGDPLERQRNPDGRDRWSEFTVSPNPSQASPGDHQLLTLCDMLDGGLMAVAERLAEHQSQRLEMLGSDEVNFEMRAAGVPQVWPRAWAIVGDATQSEASAGLSSWLRSFDDGGQRRCGIGRASSPVGEVVAVVALDALADLQAIPRTARVGQWLDVRATLLVPASKADVVVLGPRAAPRRVPSSLSGTTVQARVVVDYPGPWLIQIVPTLESGPRPALEAMVFVEQAPPEAFRAAEVPGETAPQDPNHPMALVAMLNAARRSEHLGTLRHNPTLDAAAQIHANAMQEARQVAHDVGNGSPVDRITALGLTPSMAGENVARATTLVHAHRALWASPSHRGNMLHSRFSDVGIGVAVDDDGGVWVCEVFATF